MKAVPKPAPDEYPRYASMYIDLLPDDGQVLDHLKAGCREAAALVEQLSENQLAYRCAPGKWCIKDGQFVTVRELLYHIAGHEARHLRLIRERYLHQAAGEPVRRLP